MTGTVVTFYSYKGGVGRSFALANIAVILGRWGFRVLCIDWDLEAPGLAHFFSETDNFSGNFSRLDENPGVVELLSDFRKHTKEPLEWRRYVQLTDELRTPGVSLIVAGQNNKNYSHRLHSIKWGALYRLGLGNALELMFEELRSSYDYILVDSRTGVTDFSGIVTAQLPDILAFLFTANDQSFNGATDVARRAAVARNGLAVDRSKLLLVPIPARFETQLEHSISMMWKERFIKELERFYDGWAARDISVARLVETMTIPYVPFWSFGEKLSSLENSSTDPSSINYSLETLAALLAHRLGKTHLLMDSRDEFVSSAQRIRGVHSPDDASLYLSFSADDEPTASLLSDALQSKGIKVITGKNDYENSVSSDESFRSHPLQQSKHMVALIGMQSSQRRFQEQEIRTFLRQAASDEDARLMVPILVGDTPAAELPGLLRNHMFSRLNTNYEDVADYIIRRIKSDVESNNVRTYDLTIVASDYRQHLISEVHVVAIAKDGTWISSITDSYGSTNLKLLSSKEYVLLVAHRSYSSQVVEHHHSQPMQEVYLGDAGSIGSTIVQSTGYIEGLEGRLNPILDSKDRSYLYADNISINGDHHQPFHFKTDQPFELEDALGNRFEVVCRYIRGRTSLLDYRQLRKVIFNS